MRFIPWIGALVLVALMAPPAHAEDWPPYGTERFIVYYTGTCGVSRTYHGHFEVDCNYDDYQQGTRSGRWRARYDWDCGLQVTTAEVYEVCPTGSNCNEFSEWQAISFEEFEEFYCP